MFDIKNLAAMKVGLASPETIRSWSHGEVTKPETINYRSQKPEPGGLFCEKIFGPSKDYECHCGKYKKIRYQGITCEKCGVEVTSKEWRRERFGHIDLVSPCSHIWYLKDIPSRMGLVLDISAKELEEVIYFAAHICLNPGNSSVLKYKQFLDEKSAREIFPHVIEEFMPSLAEGSADALRAEELIRRMGTPEETFDFFSTSAFIARHTDAEFGEGAKAIKRLLHEVDLNAESENLRAEIKNSTGQKRQKLTKRLEVIEAFRESDQKPEWMILDAIPVIPPDLRPMLPLDGGRFAASDLNDLYRRVISRNTRLKKLIDMRAPEVILMNERRMLQEAVDALIDNGRRSKPITGPTGRTLKSLSSGLKGKQGRFRQNLLGKRVDYSGRSVIAVGPNLKMYQCGLPREMAISLLRPFIASVMIKRGLVHSYKEADAKINALESQVYDIVEEIISQHPVLLNRAPTLHRLGIQAFQPILVDGRAIRLHPLVCTGFNADFDGDQMAVHVPLSKEAQFEALNLMLASNNILGPKDGKPIAVPSQDMILGNYWLTMEESAEDMLAHAKSLREIYIDPKNVGEKAATEEEAAESEAFAEMEGAAFASVAEVIRAYETHSIGLHNRIAIKSASIHKTFAPETDPDNVKDYALPFYAKNKYLLTTVGKVIFNEIFPDDFHYINDDPAASLETVKSWFVPYGTDLVEAIKSKSLRAPIAKKGLGVLIDQIFHKYDMKEEEYDPNGSQYSVRPSKTAAILDKIKDQGFAYSTISSVTVARSDINLKAADPNKQSINDFKYERVAEGYKKVDQITALYKKGMFSDKERHQAVCDVWNAVAKAVEDKVAEYLKEDKRNPLVIMADSGARGNIANFKQLVGMKGLVANPKNEAIELPIVSSYREGLKVAEFFINTHGARKGGADTALKTADSGYLTRRLVDVSQDVVVREVDCNCDHGFKVRAIYNTAQNTVVAKLSERLVGRFSMHDIINPKTGEVIVPGNTMISEEDANKIADAGIEEVEIRSLFTCQTKNGVCQHCYGRNMATGRLVELGEAVGIMAAQSIGEPGTQLTMRVFHTGGMAGSDITQGLPRVQELVEARNPKGKALISEIDGTIENIEDDGNGRYKVAVRSIADKTAESETPEIREYLTGYGARLRVKKGDKVEAGGKITEGAIDPKELLEYSSKEKVQVYMIKEIRKVYAAQGIGISDKHLEVIVRQMLRKLVVVDAGDTDLLPGTKVDTDRFTTVNQEALLAGKRPALAKPIVLGITKAALETESFLSATSFQQTTRILTDAAIRAKTDRLHGLKENVITGRLIPAGTGAEDENITKKSLANFTVESKMEEVRDTYIEAHDRQANKAIQ